MLSALKTYYAQNYAGIIYRPRPTYTNMDNQLDHGEGMSAIVYDRNDFYPSGESINAS